MCKLLESIIRDAIVHHMLTNKLFAEEQYGFVPGQSCATQLLSVLEDWSKALQDGNPIDAIYLDFSKAFDKVPHKRLLTKLESYGIRGEVLGWIANFLDCIGNRGCRLMECYLTWPLLEVEYLRDQCWDQHCLLYLSMIYHWRLLAQ